MLWAGFRKWSKWCPYLKWPHQTSTKLSSKGLARGPWSRIYYRKSVQLPQFMVSIPTIWIVSYLTITHTSQREADQWTKSNFLGLLPKSSKEQWFCEISITTVTVKFVHLHSFFLSGLPMFWVLLGYIVTKAYTSPRNTWFTRQKWWTFAAVLT